MDPFKLNYKVQNCKDIQNEIFDVLSLFWNRTNHDQCLAGAVANVADSGRCNPKVPSSIGGKDFP